MNRRLTLQDMAGLLAEQTGKERREAERFLREWVSVVVSSAFSDKVVKIKGLGTFKVIDIEKRESIHVGTGERFLIPEHAKFTFAPEKELKEMVNKPFSFFETVELNESTGFDDLPLSNEEEETDEEVIEELPAEEVPVVAEPTPPETPEEPTVAIPDEAPTLLPEAADTEAPEIAPTLPLVEEVLETPAPQPEPEPTPTPVVPPQIELPTRVPPTLSATAPISQELLDKELKLSQRKQLLWGRFAILLFSIALIGSTVVYFWFHFIPQKEEGHLGSTPTIGLTGTKQSPSPSATDSLRTDSLKEITPPAPAETVAPEPAPSPPQPERKTKVTIKRGDRLTQIALEQYGHKHFWVYIYKHNKVLITDPNNVSVGTELILPPPDLYGIDAKNRASIEKAAALQSQILSGKE